MISANMIVLIDSHYVHNPSDFSAAAAANGLFAAMKKDGWFDVRLLGLTDAIGDADDEPKDAFEKAAAEKLRAGAASYEEVVEKNGKRYLRIATGVPVVAENCVMCHANFKDHKGTLELYPTPCPWFRNRSMKRRAHFFPGKRGRCRISC